MFRSLLTDCLWCQRVSLTNYTKQGVPFTNNLDIVPMDAVAAEQSYFYAMSCITIHPDETKDSAAAVKDDESLASLPEVAGDFCANSAFLGADAHSERKAANSSASSGGSDGQHPPESGHLSLRERSSAGQLTVDELGEFGAPMPSMADATSYDVASTLQQPGQAPATTAFWRDVSPAERAIKRFKREQALTRYLQKRAKKQSNKPARSVVSGQSRRTKKQESRQSKSTRHLCQLLGTSSCALAIGLLSCTNDHRAEHFRSLLTARLCLLQSSLPTGRVFGDDS